MKKILAMFSAIALASSTVGGTTAFSVPSNKKANNIKQNNKYDISGFSFNLVPYNLKAGVDYSKEFGNIAHITTNGYAKVYYEVEYLITTELSSLAKEKVKSELDFRMNIQGFHIGSCVQNFGGSPRKFKVTVDSTPNSKYLSGKSGYKIPNYLSFTSL